MFSSLVGIPANVEDNIQVWTYYWGAREEMMKIYEDICISKK